MKTTKIIELSYSEIADLVKPIMMENGIPQKVKVISIKTCRPSVASAMATAIQNVQYPYDLQETLKIEIEVVQ